MDKAEKTDNEDSTDGASNPSEPTTPETATGDDIDALADDEADNADGSDSAENPENGSPPLDADEGDMGPANATDVDDGDADSGHDDNADSGHDDNGQEATTEGAPTEEHERDGSAQAPPEPPQPPESVGTDNERTDNAADESTADANTDVDPADDQPAGVDDEPADNNDKPADNNDEPADNNDEPTGAEDSGLVDAAITGEFSRPWYRRPNPALLVAAGVAVFYVLLSAAWAVDALMHQGSPARGVQVDDINVAGADTDQLNDALNVLGQRLSETEIEVTANDGSLTTTPAALGATVDTEAMITAAMEARRGRFLPFRPIRWLLGLFSSSSIDPVYTVDPEVAKASITDVLSPILTPTVEPAVAVDPESNELMASKGQVGSTVESEQLTESLPSALAHDGPYTLALTAVSAPPTLDDDTIADLATSLNALTDQPIAVRVLDKTVAVSPATMRAWIQLDNDDPDEVTWSVNEDLALSDLKPLFPNLGSEDQQARFVVVDSEPVIVPASESVVCCEQGAAEALEATIDSPPPSTESEDDSDDSDEQADEDLSIESLRVAVLQPIIADADEGVAELESLGVIEQVSTFTTKHACCENRVRNIQKFADLTQGVIIRPGESFSLNDFVGRRTRDKGFFPAGAIALGNFEDQVGGGISQYATTFFNAAFFAGIEFIEYQSHSIYISRYPRGREATISWPRPDLKVRNTTPYGILVWNEYTPTSITVSFYSTEHLEVEALDRLLSWDRQCRLDITPRRIIFPDGTVEEDRVFASYRPAEGLDCNGNSTTPEEDEPAPQATAEVAPDPTTAPPTTATAPPTTGAPTTATPTTPPAAPGDVLPEG